MQALRDWWQQQGRVARTRLIEWRNLLLVAIVLLALGLALGGVLLWAMLTLVGLMVAYALLRFLREQQRHLRYYTTRQQLKERLLLEIGSLDNEVALVAVEQLRREEWLADGSLSGLLLQGTDLRNAELWGSVMHETNLGQALLTNANLEFAEMQGAVLDDADLSGTNLRFANLSHASLKGACLRRAQLVYTHLEGANLGDADLREAQHLNQAEFDAYTVLPDGSRWQPDCDLERFTNPDHPSFWESNRF